MKRLLKVHADNEMLFELAVGEADTIEFFEAVKGIDIYIRKAEAPAAPAPEPVMKKTSTKKAK